MAKQTINVGTIANDGTGDPLRTAMIKVNENTDELYLENVVNINSADDFPAAVGGVRELSIGGAGVTYLIAATEIDMGSDRFTITDESVVIRGVHRTASAIVSTTSGNLFTCVDSSLFMEFVRFRCPNACVVDFTVPALTSMNFANRNVIIEDCDSVFTLSNSFVTSFRTLTILNATTSGIIFTGTINSQINISDMLGLSWTGSLIDFGTTTFDIINIATGSRFISPVGTTIISGLANSGNLNAGGRGIVDSNLFNGLGTALSGITTQDLKYTFHNNVFVDNVNKNTQVVAGDYLSASETVTIGTTGVFVAIGGTNWVSNTAKRFTASTAGLFTYIGLETIDVTVMAVSTVEKVGGGSDTICSEIAKNGTVEGKTIGCTENASPTGITSMGLFELATGDTIQLFVANEDSTSNIIVSNSNVIITQR